jgi:hypothetical protein
MQIDTRRLHITGGMTPAVRLHYFRHGTFVARGVQGE